MPNVAKKPTKSTPPSHTEASHASREHTMAMKTPSFLEDWIVEPLGARHSVLDAGLFFDFEFPGEVGAILFRTVEGTYIAQHYFWCLDAINARTFVDRMNCVVQCQPHVHIWFAAVAFTPGFCPTSDLSV
jgi:hypothetical protein